MNPVLPLCYVLNQFHQDCRFFETTSFHVILDLPCSLLTPSIIIGHDGPTHLEVHVGQTISLLSVYHTYICALWKGGKLGSLKSKGTAFSRICLNRSKETSRVRSIHGRNCVRYQLFQTQQKSKEGQTFASIRKEKDTEHQED